MRIHHFAIEVRQLNRSKAFYEEIMGFTEHLKINIHGEDIIFLELGGFKLELIENKLARAADYIHLCFEVGNLNDLVNRLEEYTLIPEEGPCELENGWKNAFYRGPDNELIEFLQAKI